ncbi:MAG: ComEC/Rec2 family competence protein [Candidatus Limnocylindrales bacterium]
MRARPAWLALGAIVASGTAGYEPMGGDSAVAVVAAVAVSVALAAAACLCRARERRGLGAALVIASLGAAMVAARLAIGLSIGGGVGPVETTALPDASGPWNAGVESAHTTNGLQIATIHLTDRPVRCSAQFPVYPRLIVGDMVVWSGRVRPLADGEYDRYLAAQGISATCEATDLTLVSHDDSTLGHLEAIRQASGDALQKVLPEPEGGLATAILIGLRDRVDRGLAADFTTAGVSHIVAISGWNIAIVAATVAASLRGFVGRRRRAAVTIGAIVAYTLFAGASPSVVRAALMSGVALLAVESGRGSRVVVSLAWAISVMLLLDPGIVGDVGFQLSAAATAGLVAWGTPLAQRIGKRFPRLPSGLRDTLGLSLAAQASTLPIVLLTFGRLSLIAPAANLVAVPLVPPVMAAGAVAFVAGWLAVAGAPVWMTGLLAMPGQLLLAALVAVVRLAASVPGANETLPFPANVAAAATAGLLLLRMDRALRGSGSARVRERKPAMGTGSTGDPRGPRPRRGQQWALAGAAFFIVAAGSVVAARPDGSIHVIVLDVGQGDSILLEGDRGSRVLVDGGPDANALMAALDRYVPSWDRHLDAIVLTHPHDDHVAGLVAVVERYRVDRAFESGWPAKTPVYESWKAALSSSGLRAERLSTGQTLRLDDATLRVLWPDDGTTRPGGLDPTATENRKTNDASIVLLGDYEGRRFLLTGDVEDDVDPVLIARGLSGVDMLKVAHHGSATASSDDLLAAVHPSVAVVSVGANNRYGHPNAGTMTRIRAHSRTALRTDQSGTVETTLDRAAVTVTPSRGAGNDSPGAAASHAAAAGPPGLLYDQLDVSAQPPRQRGPAPLTRAPCLAPPPRPGSCRDGGLAGVAGRLGWTAGRSPPG